MNTRTTRIFDRKLLLSTIALGFGWLLVLVFSNFTNPNRATPEQVAVQYYLGGIYILVGTAAYRSCKRRKLGIVNANRSRLTWEILGILFVAIHPWIKSMWRDAELFVTYPTPVPLLWIWVLFAYLAISLKRGQADTVEGADDKEFPND